MNTLSCTNLTKKFGKNEVLKGISLNLEYHKIYGLIGRNGAGKTTLLGLLSGQNIPTSGEIKYKGEQVWENQNVLNEICFSREINQNTMMGGDRRKIKDILKLAAALFPKWDKNYAKELIKEFNLEIKKPIATLSKGMLSATTIIIALASKSAMTFLDEPVAGLDVFMRDKFYKLLLDEYLSTERTFVISTHIIDEATNVLEDIIIMDEGQIVRCENTEELLSRHRLIHGKDEEIDLFAKNYNILHSETLGRSKTICIEVKDMKAFEEDVAKYSFDVSQASLQGLFMQLLA